MKIGIVVDNELNNDIRVLREIRILKEQGFEIFVLCFGFSTSYKDPLSLISITRINIPRKLKDILSQIDRKKTSTIYQFSNKIREQKHIKKVTLII